MNKYHAKKTIVDGIEFDSRHEADRWSELRLMERAGAISDLRRQVRFVLQDPFMKNGKRYREIAYIADFVYHDNYMGKIIVEDAKGMKTDVFKLKAKMFEKRYPDLTITEV